MPRTICKNQGCRGLIATNELGHGSRCPPCKAKYHERRARSQQEAMMRTRCAGWQCVRTVRKQQYHDGPGEWTGRCWSCQHNYEQEQESIRVAIRYTERKAAEAETELMFYKRLKDRLDSYGVHSVHQVLTELLDHIIQRKSQ